MQHPDEGTIHTWLDGELAAEDAAAFESHVAECPECAAAIAEARGLVAASSRIVSALDWVPRDVIPKPKPALRAWYSSTQFRAAAAFVVVAGASLVIIRSERQSPTMALADRGVPAVAEERTKKPVLAPMSKDMPEVPSANRVVIASPKAQAHSEKPKALSKNAPRAAAANAQFEGKEAAPITARSSVAMKAVDTRGRVIDALSAGVTVADESDANIIIVRSDSSDKTKRTVFQLAGGVQVTLTEIEPPVLSARAMAQAIESRIGAARKSAIASVPQAPAPTEASRRREAHAITWTDPETGKSYMLTGPLSSEQLEALKTRLVKLR